jgi:hypothetical protein
MTGSDGNVAISERNDVREEISMDRGIIQMKESGEIDTSGEINTNEKINTNDETTASTETTSSVITDTIKANDKEEAIGADSFKETLKEEKVPTSCCIFCCGVIPLLIKSSYNKRKRSMRSIGQFVSARCQPTPYAYRFFSGEHREDRVLLCMSCVNWQRRASGARQKSMTPAKKTHAPHRPGHLFHARARHGAVSRSSGCVKTPDITQNLRRWHS